MTPNIGNVALHRVDVSPRTSWLMVELTTADGITGTGECSDLRPAESAVDVLEGVIPAIGRHRLGEDPSRLDHAMTLLLPPSEDPRQSFGPRLVLGAVMTALCDIEAQLEGQPLSVWLGGRPVERVPLYANINRAPMERTPTEFAAVAATAVGAGFERIKLAPFDGPALPGATLLETGISHLRAVREAVGGAPTVYVDVHHRLADEELLPAVRAMEELGVGWVEDAVDVRQPAMLERLATMTDIPLAGGEQLTDESEVAALCAGGWLTYLLLDPKYIGGPLRFRSMLGVVDGAELTLHDPTGPISTAVSAHLTTMSNSSGPLEYAFGERIDRSALVTPPEHLDGDRLVVPVGAGIGTRLTKESSGNGHRVQTWQP